MDKLFWSDQRILNPGSGVSGAMTARGLKDTSSRPPKDLGGTLRRTIRTALPSLTAAPAETFDIPGCSGRVANRTVSKVYKRGSRTDFNHICKDDSD